MFADFTEDGTQRTLMILYYLRDTEGEEKFLARLLTLSSWTIVLFYVYSVILWGYRFISAVGYNPTSASSS